MFTPEQLQKIAEVLTAKHLNACPSCGRLKTFEIGQALVAFPLQHNPQLGLSLTGSFYPCVPLTCNYCGFVMFYNLVTLGLAEFFGLVPQKEVGTNG
jgi:hypothetical protein